MVRIGPFKELQLSHHFGPNPLALPRLLGLADLLSQSVCAEPNYASDDRFSFYVQIIQLRRFKSGLKGLDAVKLSECCFPSSDRQKPQKANARAAIEAPGPPLKNYITPAGLQRLRDEYSFLLSRERPAVVEVVAWAAGNGDRSENADYLYGKRRLNQIDSRIRFLTKRIDAAVVVDPAARRPASVATRVFFGATVTYKDATDVEHVVSIVGIDEVDLDRGYISWRSPLANALMKASPGDRVDLRAPAKTEHLEIIEVEYAPIPMDPFREPLGAQAKPKVERS